MRLVLFLIVTLVGIIGGVVLYFSKKLKLFVIGFVLLLIGLISGFSIVNTWNSEYKVAKQSIYVKNLGDLSSTYKNVVDSEGLNGSNKCYTQCEVFILNK